MTCGRYVARPQSYDLECDLPEGHDGPHEDRKPRKPGLERDACIVRLRDEGRTLRAIGRLFGVTTERVRQIDVRTRGEIRNMQRARWEHVRALVRRDDAWRWSAHLSGVEPVTVVERIALRHWFDHGGADAFAALRS